MEDMTTARFLPAFFLVCVLSSCGIETDRCAIDCENVFRPGSRKLIEEELSCEDCQAKFRALRESLCGEKPSVGCVCTYGCEHFSDRTF